MGEVLATHHRPYFQMALESGQSLLQSSPRGFGTQMRNYFVDGDWNAICMRCGLKHKASFLKQEWTGLRVCSECFEVRHPQTLIRMPEEQVNTPWASPEPDYVFVNVPYISSTVGKQS